MTKIVTRALLLIAVLTSSTIGLAQNPQLASPACQACRNACVSKRETCKSWACSHAGGKNKGAQCDSVVNQTVFISELKAC
jgi:ribosomal protein L37AE/L43A